MAKFAGVSTPATGTINNGSASLLSFSKTLRHVIVCNRSGQPAFFKINDPAGAQLVSATVFNFFLEDKQQFVIEDGSVDTLGVFVAATSGVSASGF
jgi:hypothetical protein